MAVREILLYPHPVLRRPTREVESFGDELRRVVDDLAETMYAAPGVGLAAPQVGVELRVAVVDVAPGAPESRLHVLVNPRIVAAEGRQTSEEGCLSIPGFAEKVDRPERIRVAGADVDGRPIELEAGGFLARAFCHEIDHLDGILFFERLTGLRKEMALRRLRKLPYVEDTA
ncbi:MAG: peptide deformylase [Acidobacteriota bacterium]